MRHLHGARAAAAVACALTTMPATNAQTRGGGEELIPGGPALGVDDGSP